MILAYTYIYIYTPWPQLKPRPAVLRFTPFDDPLHGFVLLHQIGIVTIVTCQGEMRCWWNCFIWGPRLFIITRARDTLHTSRASTSRGWSSIVLKSEQIFGSWGLQQIQCSQCIPNWLGRVVCHEEDAVVLPRKRSSAVQGRESTVLTSFLKLAP